MIECQFVSQRTWASTSGCSFLAPPEQGQRSQQHRSIMFQHGIWAHLCLHLGVLVLGAIHLGNHHRVDLGKALGQLLVGGGQGLQHDIAKHTVLAHG